VGVEGLDYLSGLQLEEPAQQGVNWEDGLLGAVGENKLQASSLEDQLAPLFPEKVPEDEEEAQEGHGAAEQGADGYAGVDGNAGAEGPYHQVDNDAGENQEHALEEGLEGPPVGAHGDPLDLIDGGHVGLLPVLFVQDGDDSLHR
jgi:hypothetical protein